MKTYEDTVPVVDFAWQIINMDRLIKAQNKELERLKDIEEKYNKLLDDSIHHGEVMMGITLELLVKPENKV
jgi:hypothetical protein